MQYAFRGHIVVLCDQLTASDGEAFTEGFKRLKLGKVIGMRTWGGEIWLSFNNTQADNGIATAAELGVYGPDGKWLIEGHGVEPDIVVDNLPHATFSGNDAQLEAALKPEGRDQDDPRPVPQPAVSRQVFPFERIFTALFTALASARWRSLAVVDGRDSQPIVPFNDNHEGTSP